MIIYNASFASHGCIITNRDSDMLFKLNSYCLTLKEVFLYTCAQHIIRMHEKDNDGALHSYKQCTVDHVQSTAFYTS